MELIFVTESIDSTQSDSLPNSAHTNEKKNVYDIFRIVYSISDKHHLPLSVYWFDRIFFIVCVLSCERIILKNIVAMTDFFQMAIRQYGNTAGTALNYHLTNE